MKKFVVSLLLLALCAPAALAVTRDEAAAPMATAPGIIDAERVAELVNERLNGARIVELELDWDDGRYLYEGEAVANGRRYSFELDANTGEFVEFERD